MLNEGDDESRICLEGAVGGVGGPQGEGIKRRQEDEVFSSLCVSFCNSYYIILDYIYLFIPPTPPPALLAPMGNHIDGPVSGERRLLAGPLKYSNQMDANESSNGMTHESIRRENHHLLSMCIYSQIQ